MSSMEPDLLTSDLLSTSRRATRRGAVVLGATLALGTCSLAGCGDDVDLGPKMPPLATTSPEEPDEPDDTLALPDVEAETARVASVELTPGFVPDPLTRGGTTAGGPVDASEFDDRCRGWMAAQPDYLLEAPRPFAELSVMVAAAEDASLMIIGPDGEARCGDDEDGVLPIVRGPLPAGRHRVWVGTGRQGASVAFTLAVSELEEPAPSQLLQ